MTDAPWRVGVHDAPRQVEDNLWHVDADVPGMALRRRMVVARRSDGRLVIHNGVCLDPAGMAALESWGEPAYLVVPNGFHRIDAARYAARYPGIKVITPKASARRVRSVVRVDGTYADLPDDPWVAMIPLAGSRIGEGALRVRSGERSTLVFNDTVMNNPGGKAGLWWKVYGLLGSTGGPRVTPLIKLVGVRNKLDLGVHLAQLAETPGLTRVIPGHGDIIDANAPAVLRGVAAAV